MTLSEKRTFSFRPGNVLIRGPPPPETTFSASVSWFVCDAPAKAVISLPSYPYSEEYCRPTQYTNTRCPAWCDRVLMSQTAQKFLHKVRETPLCF